MTPHANPEAAKTRARGWSAATFAAVILVIGARPAAAAPAGVSAQAASLSAAAPSGFDMLMQPQTALIDVYYGGKRVGAAMADYRPGFIRFARADAVMKMIPHLADADKVRAALAEDMPAHADLACAEEVSGRCRRLRPDAIGVIFDEAAFRADVFVNPAYLDVDTPLTSRYLAPPPARPSVTGVFGGEVSGSDVTGATYDVNARIIAAFGDAHLLVEASQSSTIGLEVEQLAAAVDRGPYRAEAGLLSSPGVDLIGQGRFYGASVSTQTDTLANRDAISATPIVVYLANKAQVDLLRSGRLLSSRAYDAGNQVIDTAGLPDGAYILTLHIREAGGYTHDETRSFSKSANLPPLGMPQFFVSGGLLARNFATGLPPTAGPFAEVGYARRMTSALALDGAAAFVDGHVLAQAGATYMGALGLQMRTALLASSEGGVGLLVTSSLNWRSTMLTVDLRDGWGRFDVSPPASGNVNQAQLLMQDNFAPALSGLQVSASYALSWRGAQYGLLAAYHAAPLSKSSHAFGPSVDMPIRLFDKGLRLIASATETERGVQAYVGFRLLFSRPHASVYSDAGVSSMNTAGRRETGPVGDLVATVDRTDPRWGDAALTAGYSQTLDAGTATAGAQVRGDEGDFSIHLDRDLSGASPQTQYGAGFMVGAALTPSRAAIGGASGGDSGVIVEVEGAPPAAAFEVLINDTPRALLKAGRRLSIMLPAYRAYTVRLAPRSAAALDFDTSARAVTLYPGVVQTLSWAVESVVEVFGRALDEQGRPVAQAVIQGGRYPGLSDDNGFFQVEVSGDAILRFQRGPTGGCEIALKGVAAGADPLALRVKAGRALTYAQDQMNPAIGRAGVHGDR